MNIGKMTFKHGHIFMMECYILRVKAVDVEYIGKYKDERAYSYWMSGFVDIIHVAKCHIDKTMTFFLKLSMSCITKSCDDSHVKVWMCVLAQMEQLRHVIMHFQSSIRSTMLPTSNIFPLPVPVFPKDGTKEHEKK
jgi:hypothetical protein